MKKGIVICFVLLCVVLCACSAGKADDKFSPIPGLEVGMTLEEVSAVLQEELDGESLDFYRQGEQRYKIPYSKPVFGVVPQSVILSFTKPFSYEGKNIPAVLNMITVQMDAVDLKEVQKNISEQCSVEGVGSAESGMCIYANPRKATEESPARYAKSLTLSRAANGITGAVSEQEAEQFLNSFAEQNPGSSFFPYVQILAQKTEAEVVYQGKNTVYDRYVK